jgi:hypothetical protein
MKHHVAAKDARQGILFEDAPAARPRTSDERARADMLAIVETLAAARAHPWSARLLGWQLRTFDTLAQRVTPIEGAALKARLDAELGRLGPTGD